MRHDRPTPRTGHTLKPLVACLLAALSAATAGVPPGRVSTNQAGEPAATTWVVENCDDAGPGSLRDIIETHAQSGDSVDLGQLTCSTITLTSGEIDIGVDGLTLRGPGATQLLIDGGFGEFDYSHYRLIDHSGYGTLEIDDLSLRNRSVLVQTSDESQGACIRSRGNVSLHGSTMTQCHLQGSEEVDGGAIHAEGDVTLVQSSVSSSGVTCSSGYGQGPSRGGGIFANGNVTLSHSRIEGNRIDVFLPGGQAIGGGVFANGNLTLEYSVVHGNEASVLSYTQGAGQVKGGGIFVHGTLTMTGSTVSENHAESLSEARTSAGGIWSEGPFTITRSAIIGNTAQHYGGMLALGSGATPNRIIADSTIAANQSAVAPAGIYAVASLRLDNSTVAFNATTQPAADLDAGIRAVLGVAMQSSIVSNNTANGVAADILAPVSGANNLIQAPGISTVPAGTLVGQDPLLASLADNGGPTPTLALSPGSPAIDAGNNTGAYAWDQRGPGFARVHGAAADIGAFERGPAMLVVTPATLDFGSIDVGLTSAPMIVTLSNPGGETLTVGQIEAAAAPFAQIGGNCGPLPIEIPTNGSCTLDFTFAPTSLGPFEQSLEVDSDVGSAAIDLRGEGLLAILSVTPNLIDFSSTAIGNTSPAASITLRNAGNFTLDITGLDAAVAPFEQFGGSCGALPIQLGADQACTVDFRFAPDTPGSATQTLSVQSNVGNDDFTLLGTGIDGDRIFKAGFDS